MAVNVNDRKERAGLSGFFNKHFGRDEEGRSFAAQAGGSLLNAFTVGDGTKVLNSGYKGPVQKTIELSLMTGFIGGVTGFAGCIGTFLYSGLIHDNEIPTALSAPISALQENTDAANGYASFVVEGEQYLIWQNEGDYSIYIGDNAINEDYTFRLVDQDRALYTLQTIINYTEEQNLLAESDTIAPFAFENMSIPYLDTYSGDIVISADERVPDVEYSWTNADYNALLTAAFTHIESEDNMPVVTAEAENMLLTPSDTWEGNQAAFLGAISLLAMFGLGSGALSANAASRRRFNDPDGKQRQKRLDFYQGL
jgi:hypothetical protein